MNCHENERLTRVNLSLLLVKVIRLYDIKQQTVIEIRVELNKQTLFRLSVCVNTTVYYSRAGWQYNNQVLIDH